MTDDSVHKTHMELRSIRGRYDALSDGDKAILRRCKDSDDVRLEGSFWRIASETAHVEAVATAVLLFPCAPHRMLKDFSLGRFLKGRLSANEENRALRFRRLVQCQRPELAHRLRGLLRLASANEVGVDWGVLGADIMFFGDVVRRRWTQDFFAPLTNPNA
jgi:CRISPR type I-E-associated protein CasB/Cse2